MKCCHKMSLTLFKITFAGRDKSIVGKEFHNRGKLIK